VSAAAGAAAAHAQVAWALPLASVRMVLRDACDAVVPPKRMPRFGVLLRRAPTQEDFFRGSLPTNPVYSWDIMPADTGAPGGEGACKSVYRSMQSVVHKRCCRCCCCVAFSHVC
jgi:hypothetical protein